MSAASKPARVTDLGQSAISVRPPSASQAAQDSRPSQTATSRTNPTAMLIFARKCAPLYQRPLSIRPRSAFPLPLPKALDSRQLNSVVAKYTRVASLPVRRITQSLGFSKQSIWNAAVMQPAQDPLTAEASSGEPYMLIPQIIGHRFGSIPTLRHQRSAKQATPGGKPEALRINRIP